MLLWQREPLQEMFRAGIKPRPQPVWYTLITRKPPSLSGSDKILRLSLLEVLHAGCPGSAAQPRLLQMGLVSGESLLEESILFIEAFNSGVADAWGHGLGEDCIDRQRAPRRRQAALVFLILFLSRSSLRLYGLSVLV